MTSMGEFSEKDVDMILRGHGLDILVRDMTILGDFPDGVPAFFERHGDPPHLYGLLMELLLVGKEESEEEYKRRLCDALKNRF